MSGARPSRLVIGVSLAALLLSLGCTPATSTPSASARHTVVVSVIPQAWLVRQIGRPHVDVLTLVQPTDNPHTYQPTDAQMSRVMQADIFFRVGMPFENGPWFEAIQSSGKLTIVDTRQGIELRRMERHVHAGEAHADEEEHEQGPAGDLEGRDPHIWLSPRLLRTQARTIARALAKLDPTHATDYDHNLVLVERQLEDLDARIRQKLAPAAGKAFFVFHPAWGYFADEYGLRQVAIEIEGKQPTDAELTQLQQEAKRHGIQVIFVQPQITGQAAGAVAAAVGARLETLNPEAENLLECLLRAAEVIAQSCQKETESGR